MFFDVFYSRSLKLHEQKNVLFRAAFRAASNSNIITDRNLLKQKKSATFHVNCKLGNIMIVPNATSF